MSLAGWSYRKSITLSRASGAVTNYQMKLLVGESSGATGEDVDCEAHCKTDFSDLRFTTSDGDTLLDYYIEEITGTTPNQLATVWIEFDSIGTGDTTFYMYYGNAGASSASNGPNTFILFEDFNALNDGDLNGQNGWSGHANWDVATTTKYEGAKAVQTAAGGSAVNISKAISSGGAAYHLFVQTRMRHSAVNIQFALQIYIYEGSNQITAISISQNQFRALVTPSGWVNIGISPSNNTWYKAVLAIDAVSTHKTWVNDTQYSPANQNNLNNVSATIDSIKLEHYTASGAALVDQILVGYYLPTGPAWGSWGAEEVPSSIYNESLILAINADLARTNILSAVNTMILAVASGQGQIGGMTLEEAISLAISSGQGQTGGLTFNEAVSLAISAISVQSASMEMSAGLSLGITADQGSGSVAEIDATIALSLAAAILQSESVEGAPQTYNELVTIAAKMGMSRSAISSLQGAITLAASGSIGLSSQAVMVNALILQIISSMDKSFSVFVITTGNKLQFVFKKRKNHFTQ